MSVTIMDTGFESEAKQLISTIEHIFGVTPYRWQCDIFEKVLDAWQDILVSAGTGSGKSLLFQVMVLLHTLHLQHRRQLPPPESRSGIPDVVCRPPGLAWMTTIAEVDAGIRITQEELEQEKQLAQQEEKEEKQRGRNTKTKENQTSARKKTTRAQGSRDEKEGSCCKV